MVLTVIRKKRKATREQDNQGEESTRFESLHTSINGGIKERRVSTVVTKLRVIYLLK